MDIDGEWAPITGPMDRFTVENGTITAAMDEARIHGKMADVSMVSGVEGT